MSCKQIMAYLSIINFKMQGHTAHGPHDLNLDEVLTLCIWETPKLVVAGQLGLKSSRPLSQVGHESTRPESTRPGVFLERPVTYIWFVLHNLSDKIKDNY